MNDMARSLNERVDALTELSDWIERQQYFGCGLTITIQLGKVEYDRPEPNEQIAFEIAGPSEGYDVLSTCLASLYSDLKVSRTLAKKAIEDLAAAIKSVDGVDNLILKQELEKLKGKPDGSS